MTNNKLNLSDFLRFDEESSNKPVFSFLEPIEKQFTVSLFEFYNRLLNHSGNIIIDDITYTSILGSQYNLYFINEEDNENIILFDPIIDIKNKEDNEILVFYYPDKVFHIILKD